MRALDPEEEECDADDLGPLHRLPPKIKIDYTIPINKETAITSRQVTEYTHELAPVYKHWPTEAMAELDYRECLTRKAIEDAKVAKAAALEAQCHRLRLETAKLSDIPRLWAELLLANTGVNSVLTLSNVTFGSIHCTHHAPIGVTPKFSGGSHKDAAPTAWGWQGQVSGSWSGRGSALDVLDSHLGIDGFRFVGLHCSTGGGGNPFGFQFRLYLDDFPKLKDAFDRLNACTDESSRFENLRAKAKVEAEARAARRGDVAELMAKKERHQNMVEVVKARLSVHERAAMELVLQITKIVQQEVKASEPVLVSEFSEEEKMGFEIFHQNVTLHVR